MPAKFMTAEQCQTLHRYYPPPDCCICNARFEVIRLQAEVLALRRVVDAARIFVRDVDEVIQTTRSERRLANKLDELDREYPYIIVPPPEPTDLEGKPLFGPSVTIEKNFNLEE